MTRILCRLALAVCALATATGQTKLDLRTQTKNADFAAFPYTRPIKVATSDPAACEPGYLLFRSDAPAGSNIKLCTSTNVWTQLSVGPHTHGAADIASGTLDAARLPNPSAGALGGVRSIACPGTDKLSSIGTDGIPVCSADQGTTVTAGPSGALVIVDDEIDIDDALVPLLDAANDWSGANDFSAAALLRIVTGAGAPGAGCTGSGDVGKIYARNNAETTKATYYGCSKTGASTYAWELIGDGTGGSSGPETALFADGGDIFEGTGAAQDLYTYSMPANTLQVGDVLRVQVWGRRSNSSGAEAEGTDEYLMVGTGSENNPMYKTAYKGFHHDIRYTVLTNTTQRVGGSFVSGAGIVAISDDDNFFTDTTFDVTGSITVKLHMPASFIAGEYVAVDKFVVSRLRY